MPLQLLKRRHFACFFFKKKKKRKKKHLRGIKLQKKENLSIDFFFSSSSTVTNFSREPNKMVSESSATEDEGKAWEDALRKILLAGAPLPDEEYLDYSIPVKYQGPLVPYQIPKVDPFDLDFITVRPSTVSTISNLSLILVAMSIHPKHNKFNRIRNGNGNEVGVGGIAGSSTLPKKDIDSLLLLLRLQELNLSYRAAAKKDRNSRMGSEILKIFAALFPLIFFF